MFGTFRTLIIGEGERTKERVRQTYALELIDQKIREVDANLRAAKATLASLIQRQRIEERQSGALVARTNDLIQRAQGALEAGRDDLATEAASAIAGMENEQTIRQETLARLDQKIIRLSHSVETGTRRLLDLRQGAIRARAIRQEHRMQHKITPGSTATSAIQEAEELIGQVVGEDDPFERAEIMSEINQDLDHTSIADRLSDSGFGRSTRVTGDSVLARLKSTNAK